MSIAAIGSARVVPTGSEKVEGPGPDHDGNSDDAGAKAPVQVASAPGTGTVCDKTC
jgi:hypothetical protein